MTSRSAYRAAHEPNRRALLRRRDQLLARPLGHLTWHQRARLKGLRAQLANADRDPLDHLAALLRDYEAELYAQDAANRQDEARRRGLLRNLGFVGLVLVAMASVLGFFVHRSFTHHRDGRHPRDQAPAFARLLAELTLDAHRFWHFECVPMTDADCASTCSDDGRCHAVADTCVVGGNDDCRGSRDCQHHGDCAMVGSVCVATEDGHCAASEICAEDGRCHLSDDGWCEPRDPEDCREAAVCREAGRCTLSGQACVARSSADCAASEGCRSKGACGLRDGTCVPTEVDHCMQATVCRWQGECDLASNRCTSVPAPEDCRRMTTCVASGFCPAEDLPAHCAGEGVKRRGPV
ncbi:MAG: hypothetical protein KC731_10565 [Myxococcales bacterium]|nr:hypothetical protein [Myxococcales bacterium]